VRAQAAPPAPAAAQPSARLAAPQAKTCTTRRDVESALEQAGVSVVADSDPVSSDAVTVSVEGTPEHLRVVLVGQGHDGTTELPPATCQTAADAVSAFLVSTLAPAAAAAVSTPAPPVLEVSTLDRAIKDELARRGVQLAILGVHVSVARDESNAWFARVVGRDETNVRTLALGNFDDPSPERIDAIADDIVPVVRELSAPKKQLPFSRRQVLLADALQHYRSTPALANVLGGVELGIGSFVAVSLVVDARSKDKVGLTPTQAAVFGSAAGLWIAGGAATLLVPEDYQLDVGGVSMNAGLGALYTGFAVGHVFGSDVPSYSVASLAAGYYSEAALLTISAAVRHPRYSVLRAGSRKLRTERASDAEITALENEFALTDPAVTRFALSSPLILGGLVSTLPLFEHSSPGRTGVAILGIQSLFNGLMMNVIPGQFSTYKKSLRAAGIFDATLGPGPGVSAGLSLAGRF